MRSVGNNNNSLGLALGVPRRRPEIGFIFSLIYPCTTQCFGISVHRGLTIHLQQSQELRSTIVRIVMLT